MVPVFFIFQKTKGDLVLCHKKEKTSTRERTGVGKEGISREERRPEKLYIGMYEEVTKKRDEAADGVDPEKLKKKVPKKDSAEAVAIEWIYSLKPQIKKSTFCKYHTLIYSYIIPELGQKDINNISVMDLQNFCNNLFSTTKTRSKPLSSRC